MKKLLFSLIVFLCPLAHASIQNGTVFPDQITIANDTNQSVVISNRTYSPGQAAVISTKDQSGEIMLQVGSSFYTFNYPTYNKSEPIQEKFNMVSYTVSAIKNLSKKMDISPL